MYCAFCFRNFKSINAGKLYERLGQINLIDVREVNEFKAGHVPYARNIPISYLLSNPEHYLDKSKEYYIICQSGSRSLKACSILFKKGYKVINVKGGTSGYNKPLIIPRV